MKNQKTTEWFLYKQNNNVKTTFFKKKYGFLTVYCSFRFKTAKLTPRDALFLVISFRLF